MSKCHIVMIARSCGPPLYAVNPNYMGQVQGGVSTAVPFCQNHGMDALGCGTVCPVGRIEEATEYAILRIDTRHAALKEEHTTFEKVLFAFVWVVIGCWILWTCVK